MNYNRIKEYIDIEGKQIPLITGGKGCFAAGTFIATPTGGRPIENIRVGDEVLCFDDESNQHISKVTNTFIHYNEETIRVSLWGSEGIIVTSNHWFLTPENDFREIGDFADDDGLVSAFAIVPITKIENECVQTVYNITVAKYHTYYANNIKVHNKGGGKGGGAPSPGVEHPNTLFSTDLLFLTIALGEGPIYRIHPNGPQDIEINESVIDDLIKLDGDGTVNTDLFVKQTTTGTLNQEVLGVFGQEVVTPQTFSSPVQLKKGNVEGVPRAAIVLQSTSPQRWDALEFFFIINALQRLDDEGNIFGYKTAVKVTVFDATGAVELGSVDKEINGKTNTDFKFTITINIPEEDKSASGYKFSIEKTSDDNDSAKIQDGVSIIGWNEIDEDDQSYPRTSLFGLIIKAHSEHQGAIPTFTSLIKGLICKVPANYNQPILENGDVDWRQLELADSGTEGYPIRGYRLQKQGITVQNAINPVIYEGFWDGSFTFAWTQNPIWILYDILTNTTYGLGIPESYIDKFKFFKVAQYCDGVDPKTGEWFGVDGFADGSFRHKPRERFTTVREVLIGLNFSTQIKERRFICDVTISTQKQVFDLINQVATVFRGVIIYAGGKISLNVDLPDEFPVAIFSEANILKDTLVISGIKESELITGVEVTYIEPANHFKRETVRIDDPEALRDLNQIENIQQVEAFGVIRRSQAVRFGQYILASNKFIRRKATWKVSSEALNIGVGDVVAVSQRGAGTAWGYGGRIANDSPLTSSNVLLEHFTSPAITSAVFTANTLPVGLRIIGKNNDRVDLFLVSNTIFAAIASGNTQSGVDLVETRVLSRFKPQQKLFSTQLNDIQFQSNNQPLKGDLWTLGEIDPTNVFRNKSDKLFKVTGIERDEQDEGITIHASEYVSNVYTDSDSIINYVPVRYEDTFSPLIAPPAPILKLLPIPIRSSDGSVRYELEVQSTTDTTGYPISIKTLFEYAAPADSILIEGLSNEVKFGLQPVTKGALTLTGFIPFLDRSWVIPVPEGILKLSVNTELEQPKGDLTLTGQIPGLGLEILIAKGSLSLTGFVETSDIGPNIPVPVGVLTITGQSPIMDVVYDFLIPKGDLTLTGFLPNIDTVADPLSGDLTLIGQIPIVNISYNITVSKGDLTLTGFIPSPDVV